MFVTTFSVASLLITLFTRYIYWLFLCYFIFSIIETHYQKHAIINDKMKIQNTFIELAIAIY